MQRSACSRGEHPHGKLKQLWHQDFEFMVTMKYVTLCEVMCAAPPVEAVLESFADSAEVSGVSHRSAVQRVVPQIYW